MNTKIDVYNTLIRYYPKQNNSFAQNLVDYSMESNLKIKNFGPIIDVDIKLKNVNVFIGPQASGKSVLAKIYTIFKAPRKFFFDKGIENNSEIEIKEKEFQDVLEEYNIKSFLKADTEIEFDSVLHFMSYKNGKLSYTPKLRQKIEVIKNQSSDFDLYRNTIVNSFKELIGNFIVFNLRAAQLLIKFGEPFKLAPENIDKVDEITCLELINIIEDIEEDLSKNAALYIPAERNLSNIVKKSALNLIINKVPIPKHILSFGAELEKIEVDEIDLGFLHESLKYKTVNNEDVIYSGEHVAIKLHEAASGIQSVVPVLVPILHRKEVMNHRSFVIEEPELNLFPTAQYNLIQLLESNRNESYWEDWGTIHTYTTHSPYVLSALNNLLYAGGLITKLNHSDVTKGIYNNYLEANKANEQEVHKIVKATISPISFTAYQINEGSAMSIFNDDTGLIDDNYIDESSDTINEDFEALMELANDRGI